MSGINEKFEVKRSPIHGKGVFAKRRFRRNALLGVYEGRRVRQNDTYVLWVELDDGKVVGIDGENELRWVNHSKQPVAEFRGDRLFALRDIEPGTEITCHYGDDWADVD